MVNYNSLILAPFIFVLIGGFCLFFFHFFFKLKFYVFLYYIFGGFELWSATYFVCFLTLTLLCFVDAIWSCWGNHIRLGIWHFVWVLFPPSLFVIGCLLSAWIFLDRQRKFIKKAPNKRRVDNPCTWGAIKGVPKGGKNNTCKAQNTESSPCGLWNHTRIRG